MELTDPPDKFSEFIGEIVSAARSTILRHGGYFDKETGDGVIGHFCSHGNVPTSSTDDSTAMEIIAVRAGQEIVQFVHDLSAEYQRWLRHGMDRLGAAIGIHTGTAVWLVDEMQVRAIGSSVVGAARLCNCADTGEIVVSNKTYHSVEEFQGTVAGLTFRRKQVSLQEYSERLGTYAYSARVIA
jgi:class 3 adenylate cyclase